MNPAILEKAFHEYVAKLVSSKASNAGLCRRRAARYRLFPETVSERDVELLHHQMPIPETTRRRDISSVVNLATEFAESEADRVESVSNWYLCFDLAFPCRICRGLPYSIQGAGTAAQLG